MTDYKQLELYKWKDYYIIVDDRMGYYLRLPEEMALELNAKKVKFSKNQLELKLEFKK